MRLKENILLCLTIILFIEGEYPPLPDDNSFYYSASSPNLCGGGNETDGDNDDDDDLETKLTDEYIFLNVWPIIWIGIVLTIAVTRPWS